MTPDARSIDDVRPSDTPALIDLQDALCHHLEVELFPSRGTLDGLAPPEHRPILDAISAWTDPARREARGEISLLRPGDRPVPAQAPLALGAFTRLNPLGSRFARADVAIWYGALELETALVEVAHDLARWLRFTREPAIDIGLRVTQAELVHPLHDLDAWACRWMPAVLHPDDHATAQRLGRHLRGKGSWGVVWPSVRHPGGRCVAVFRAPALRNLRMGQRLCLHWDGRRFTHWSPRGEPHTLPEGPGVSQN